MTTLSGIIFIIGKAFLLALAAPFVSGIIRKTKNCMRMRRGQGLFQFYFDIRKLFSKDEVISKNVSWIFFAAPAVVFTASVLALLMILMVQPGSFTSDGMAILIAVFFVFGLARFFLALAGLDAGSSFGGMGSSREMFISSFAEPAIFITAFVLCVSGGNSFKVSNLLALFSVSMAVIAETSRIPVDNKETHLELTMIHEAMVLEYSGRSLALIELASHIKQIVFFTILSWYIFTPQVPGIYAWAIFPAKIAAISIIVAFVEISLAKMRLFRAVDFLSFSFFIALVASIAASLGL
ncbi:MAG: NADH-quinone oxidoreductase subunit H [Candidatus Omnitrophica bacterium]|nr:NADH-quinone oxidoreductase subunit H [Candidatus Omnitrophota bacterium]